MNQDLEQAELERQNQRLDKLNVVLENLHHVSKTVGDELEEQITLIEKLEDETDRAQHAAKSLHTNLKKNALQREQNTNTLLNVLLVLVLCFLLLVLIYVWKH